VEIQDGVRPTDSASQRAAQPSALLPLDKTGVAIFKGDRI